MQQTVLASCIRPGPVLRTPTLRLMTSAARLVQVSATRLPAAADASSSSVSGAGATFDSTDFPAAPPSSGRYAIDRDSRKERREEQTARYVRNM
jgi:hypothetical protein